MGNIIKPCGSKANRSNNSLNSNIVQHDLHKLIPQMLSIPHNEFKRIFKQSKKLKYTKKLLSKTDGDQHKIVDDSTLMELPPYKTTNAFIIKSKSLINAASVLSLVIVKDIIFQISIIPDHIHKYMPQYNHLYHKQLQQRYVNLPSIIMMHHGAINDLFTTIKILLHIGYVAEDNYLILLYEDLSFLDEIKFHLSLREKLTLNEYDYQQHTHLHYKRYILYEKLSDLEHNKHNQIENKNTSVHITKYVNVFDDTYLLISGYLEGIYSNYSVIPDIIELCMKFYLIPNDTNYGNLLSFSQREYPYSNALKLDVYNFDTKSQYSLNINGLNSDGTHYMYLVRNISLPKWILDDIVDLRCDSIYDDNYFRVMNSKTLCCIYDQITHRIFDTSNNKQAMIIFDPYNAHYGGYNIEFAKSFALNLYLWKADRKIYHRARNSIICLNRIGSKSCLSEYDIDENKYISVNGILQIDRCEGAGMCLFDNESKLLLSGGHTPCNNDKTLKSSEIHCISNTCSCCDECAVNNYGYFAVSDMNLRRMNHGMLYEKELQQIIVGGGQDKEVLNWKEIDSYFNKYRYLTPHTIEILDLNKNKWKLIDCKTNNGYASNPYLWYNNSNPFVINIFNSYLAYSGKRANHSEFIDIREQTKWYQNQNINDYLKQNDTCHISMF